MTLQYLLSKRTNGANPFKIFESIKEVNDGILATRIRCLNYDEFLETAYWFAISQVAKSRAGMRCQVCNSPTKISAHHRTYENHGSEHLHMNDITVLCEMCHGIFHGHMEAPPPKEESKRERRAEKRRLESTGEKPPRFCKDRIIPHTEEDVGMPNGDTFVLDIDLINACRANGSFTNATLNAFGLTAPLISGWIDTLIGKRFSRDEYRKALEGRFVYRQKLAKRPSNPAVPFADCLT